MSPSLLLYCNKSLWLIRTSYHAYATSITLSCYHVFVAGFISLIIYLKIECDYSYTAQSLLFINEKTIIITHLSFYFAPCVCGLLSDFINVLQQYHENVIFLQKKRNRDSDLHMDTRVCNNSNTGFGVYVKLINFFMRCRFQDFWEILIFVIW